MPLMPTWKFLEMQRGDVNRDPIEGQFFSTEALESMADALVREAIQNSLDAALGGGPVRVRIAFSSVGTAMRRTQHAAYFESLWPHLRAPQSGLRDLPDPLEPVHHLVIEDFGTRGLNGDVRQYEDQGENGRRKNDFYYGHRHGAADRRRHCADSVSVCRDLWHWLQLHGAPDAVLDGGPIRTRGARLGPRDADLLRGGRRRGHRTRRRRSHLRSDRLVRERVAARSGRLDGRLRPDPDLDAGKGEGFRAFVPFGFFPLARACSLLRDVPSRAGTGVCADTRMTASHPVNRLDRLPALRYSPAALAPAEDSVADEGTCCCRSRALSSDG